jgi:hypothetical protein
LPLPTIPSTLVSSPPGGNATGINYFGSQLATKILVVILLRP